MRRRDLGEGLLIDNLVNTDACVDVEGMIFSTVSRWKNAQVPRLHLVCPEVRDFRSDLGDVLKSELGRGRLGFTAAVIAQTAIIGFLDFLPADLDCKQSELACLADPVGYEILLVKQEDEELVGCSSKLHQLFCLFPESQCVNLLQFIFALNSLFDFDFSLLNFNQMKFPQDVARSCHLGLQGFGFSQKEESAEEVGLIFARIIGLVTDEDDVGDDIRRFSVARFEKHGPCGQFENGYGAFVV